MRKPYKAVLSAVDVSSGEIADEMFHQTCRIVKSLTKLKPARNLPADRSALFASDISIPNAISYGYSDEEWGTTMYNRLVKAMQNLVNSLNDSLDGVATFELDKVATEFEKKGSCAEPFTICITAEVSSEESGIVLLAATIQHAFVPQPFIGDGIGWHMVVVDTVPLEI